MAIMLDLLKLEFEGCCPVLQVDRNNFKLGLGTPVVDSSDLLKVLHPLSGTVVYGERSWGGELAFLVTAAGSIGTGLGVDPCEVIFGSRTRTRRSAIVR